MKVLQVRAATSIWLVDARDLNPRGVSVPTIASLLQGEFKFQSHQGPDPSGQKPEAFSLFDGVFEFESKPYAILHAKAYNDGFVLTSGHSTAHSDAALNSMFEFLAARFGFPKPTEIAFRKSYISELVVSLTKDFGGLFAPPVSTIQKRLSELSGEALAPMGLSLLTEPQLGKVQVIFRLEREGGKPFAENRYWSVAPVSTPDHESILSAMENAL